ncbi:hypothetical protein CDL12_19626 [Handroanthus impetiginosus]|uniref:Uncharacterized protein n=1 Tax=Handroanthus impetiginosus TaxID=429701 RepID=A0A2G9GR77_9LAMI|nr:hypothetical protein CDL12_19626 [Handroanthus impetiginosus]
MGTRQVYEEKLRRESLDHYPTIRPVLGSAPCPRCLSLKPHEVCKSLDELNRYSFLFERCEWEITPVLHDVIAVAVSGVGAMLSAVHGFNTGIPYVQQYLKGTKWFPLVIGAMHFQLFTELTATSYHAASSASHYGISLLTGHIEDDHVSRTQHKELR